MDQRILIPLDGSKLGEAALHYVEELISNLAAEQKMEVHLIQIIALPTRTISVSDGMTYVPFTEEEMEPTKKKVLAYLEQAGEGLRSKGAMVKCKVIVSKAGVSSAEEIIKAEDEIHADLVAMSTHGRRGLSKWAFGSVTEKVLRAGKVPVLVARAGKRAND